MFKIILSLVLFFMAGNAFATTYYYSTQAEAQQALYYYQYTGHSQFVGTSKGQSQSSSWNQTACYNTSPTITTGLFIGYALTYYSQYAAPTDYFGYCQNGLRQNCSSGMERSLPTGSCSCPLGQTLVNGVCAAPIVQDCPSGQYKTASYVCEQITTDCNLNVAGGGNFFNTATASCESVTPLVICVAKDSNNTAGNNSVYCPPISDCIAPGQMCSDNQIDVQAKADTRTAEVAAAKAKADAAAAEAAQAKADKDAAKAAKDAAATASAEQAAAAQAAAQAAAAQGTTSITAIQAAQAAAQAAQRQAADAIAAANAAAQGLIVDIQEAIAGDRQVAITQYQGTLGGNMAGDLGQQAEKAAEKAKAAAWGAQGGYAPDGQSSAGETGIPQQTDCPDCAKEGTLQGIKDDLESSDNDYSGETDGTPTLVESNTKLFNALKGHFTLPNIGPIVADCPVFTKDIPFINVTLTIDQFCTMEPIIRPYIEGAVTVMYSIMGLFIVLGA